MRQETEAADRVLREMGLGVEGAKLTLDPAAVTHATEFYYRYFYHDHADEMLYLVKKSATVPVESNLLEWLTDNQKAWEYFRQQQHQRSDETKLLAAPESVAQQFHVIDSPTQSVVVPYGEAGPKVIADLCAAFRDPDGKIVGEGKLIVNARPYTVNLYDTVFNQLINDRAIHEVQKGVGIYHLDPRYYDAVTGVSCDPTGASPSLVAG